MQMAAAAGAGQTAAKVYKPIPGYPESFAILYPTHKCGGPCVIDLETVAMYGPAHHRGEPCIIDLERRAVFGEPLTWAELNRVIHAITNPRRLVPSYIAVADALVKQTPELKHACDIKSSVERIAATYGAKQLPSPAEIVQLCFAFLNGVLVALRVDRIGDEPTSPCSQPVTPKKRQARHRRRSRSVPTPIVSSSDVSA